MNLSINKIKSIAVTSIAVLFFYGCENDLEQVKIVSTNEEERKPMEIQKDIEYVYTDSARVTLRLLAPLAENYPQLEEPYLEFNEGIEVIFYKNEVEDSRLSANYGINYPNKKMWVVKGNVVVYNQQGEELNTEHLVWDVPEERIYSDEFVKITSEGTVTTGEGFESNQDLTDYRIKKVTGIINIEDDVQDVEGS